MTPPDAAEDASPAHRIDAAEGDRGEPAYIEDSNGKEILVWNGAALVSALDGSLSARDHGYFVGDTRMLARHALSVDGQPLTLLSRVRAQNQNGSWTYRNPELKGTIKEGALLVTLDRRVDGVLHEDLRIESFVDRPAHVVLRVDLDTDFADSFEIKEAGHLRQRDIARTVQDSGLDFAYRRGDFARELQVRVTADSAPRTDEQGIAFDLELAAGVCWTYCLTATPVLDGVPFEAECPPHPAREPRPAADVTRVQGTSTLALAFDQGRRDLEALAMRYQGSQPFVAAGVPWFLAVFGRDALLTGLMAGSAAPWALQGALDVLAPLQATTRDDAHDAEPGKFPHELRTGEKAYFNEIMQTPYYGGHDIPALYCLALWQAWRWTGDPSLLDRYLPRALAALEWCAEFGDRDGDGLLEYATRAGDDGYYNQSWKDAEEAIVDEAGRKAPLPLATVELQGYWFAAQVAIAELLLVQGDAAGSEALLARAEQLRQLVEARYWLPDDEYYALALDREKRPLRAVASNPAHLLWCGLPSAEHARAAARRLMEPELFTGWGLRTLSSATPGYSPLSYQNGSVWPHDTALAAAGLLRYGLHAEAHQLIEGLLDAAARMPEHRLPELLAGTDRKQQFLTPHPDANSPQAWGAATPVLLPQLLLGLSPDAPRRRCVLRPVLPEWLPRLEVRDIRVGRGRFSVTAVRRGEATEIEELSTDGVEVVVDAPNAHEPLWSPVTREHA